MMNRLFINHFKISFFTVLIRMEKAYAAILKSFLAETGDSTVEGIPLKEAENRQAAPLEAAC